MRYVSTRGTAPILDFEGVLLAGLARDGGLYVPESWPRQTDAFWRDLAGLPYHEVCARIMTPFVGDSLSQAELAALTQDAYAGFRHKAVAPLTQMGPDRWMLELFHGQTIAFKDYALQLLGRLFDHFLAKRGRRIAVLGATSGDTGSAAIEACRDRAAIDIFILFPHGRVSDVQRRQMTTVPSQNVHALAVDGSFDDCQDIVKALFNDHAFRDRVNLAAINSINWARIIAQTAYYAASAVAIGAPDRAVSFSVPTGNFGNVFAGYVAKQMGLPINRFLIGTNRNDVISRFFNQGEMRLTPVEPSLSPSMDIQVSSNLERLLFELYDRDGAALGRDLTRFRSESHFSLSANALTAARKEFAAIKVDDAETLAAMRRVYEETGQVIDPHSAIAQAATQSLGMASDGPIISLACAHPAKFPDAVIQATGITPTLPPHLDGLMTASERVTRLPNDPAAVAAYLAKALDAGAAA
jgi:threonine synthase